MISPNMKEFHRRDKSQWIPWEISFSLKETTRNDRTSLSNAILAVVLPDSKGSYEYFVTDHVCLNCICHSWNTDILFAILRENMFNQIIKTPANCEKGLNGIFSGEPSYIKCVKWSDLKEKPQEYIKTAIKIKKNIDEYDITKEVN
jgi:hypothetical protein